MFVFDRPVRFSDIDAARIVFFARYLEFCHDALEALFAGLDGGYPGLTMHRHIGVPSVHVEVDYKAPLRYGDVAQIQVTVAKMGTKSIIFRYEFVRKADGVHCASVLQVVVTSDLIALEGVPIPEDVRALLLPHVVARASQPSG